MSRTTVTSEVVASPLREFGAGVWALWRGIVGLPQLAGTHPYAAQRTARALVDYLWRPLPTVAALAALIGVIAGLLCAGVLKRANIELEVTPNVAGLLVGQVAPLLLGIFAAGRISVALAARLGGMQLQGELDALVLRGQAPADFVLGPVVATMLIAAPLLTAAAGLAALIGMGAMLSLEAVTPAPRFAHLVAITPVARQVFVGVLRSYAFLLLATAAGAASGSASIRDLRDLERRTATAFTSGLLLIFAAAALSDLIK